MASIPLVAMAVLTGVALRAGSDSATVSVSSVTVGLSHNLRCTSATPVVLVPRADGCAYLGYSDTTGNLHIVNLDSRLRRVGRDRSVSAHRLVALHAHPDDSVALLVSTEEGPNEQRPGWCAAGDNTLWLLKLDPDGHEVFRTRLAGGEGYGPQARWFFPNCAGVLHHNGSHYGAFYALGRNFARAGDPPNSHEGDEFKAIDGDGRILENLSKTWNASHSYDQRMLLDRAGHFLTLIMGDAYPIGVLFKVHPQGARQVVWPQSEYVLEMKRRAEGNFLPGYLGGMAQVGDGLAAIVTTHCLDDVDKSTNKDDRHVLFLGFDTGGTPRAKRYLTSEPGPRKLTVCIAPLGRHCLVGWGEPTAQGSTLVVLDNGGSEVVRAWETKHPMPTRKNFVNLADGDVVWPSARDGAKRVLIHRAAVPRAFRVSPPEVPRCP